MRAKKNALFLHFFPKQSLKTSFWPVFFSQNFTWGAEILTETGTFYWFRRARKMNLLDQKKQRSTKFQKLFENPPPRENSKSEPVQLYCFEFKKDVETLILGR